MSEQAYIMVKPDGVERGLTGEIIKRFSEKGLKLKGLKAMVVSRELAEDHYSDLSAKPFFGELVDYIISGPVVAMVWEGPNACKVGRTLIGATNPVDATPGTIRGDYALTVAANVIHGSDCPENGAKEVALWFKPEELLP